MVKVRPPVAPVSSFSPGSSFLLFLLFLLLLIFFLLLPLRRTLNIQILLKAGCRTLALLELLRCGTGGVQSAKRKSADRVLSTPRCCTDQLHGRVARRADPAAAARGRAWRAQPRQCYLFKPVLKVPVRALPATLYTTLVNRVI